MSDSEEIPNEDLIDQIDDREGLDQLLMAFDHRLSTLEAELDREREKRQELEERYSIVDIRDGAKDSVHLEDIYIADIPIGRILTAKAAKSDLESLEDRLDGLVEGQIQREASEDSMLPIQQVNKTRKVEDLALDKTERRAAIVWSEFFDFAKTTPTKYVLDSTEVGKILSAYDEDGHRETRSRVMDLVATLGEELIEVTTVRKKKALVIDQQRADEFYSELLQEVNP